MEENWSLGALLDGDAVRPRGRMQRFLNSYLPHPWNSRWAPGDFRVDFTAWRPETLRIDVVIWWLIDQVQGSLRDERTQVLLPSPRSMHGTAQSRGEARSSLQSTTGRDERGESKQDHLMQSEKKKIHPTNKYVRWHPRFWGKKIRSPSIHPSQDSRRLANEKQSFL